MLHHANVTDRVVKVGSGEGQRDRSIRIQSGSRTDRSWVVEASHCHPTQKKKKKKESAARCRGRTTECINCSAESSRVANT